MRAHWFQHVPFEGLGSIEPWLKSHGFGVSRTRFFADEALSSMDGIDFLIVMGGPMSVNEEDRFPWLVREKQWVREFMETGRPVLGICLGAQLIASALGARVYPNPVKEIGWFPVRGDVTPEPGRFALPSSTTVFHWHGETFDLPAGARRIAASDGCQNQGFQIGMSVMGLQFHLETTHQSARDMVEHGRDELVPAGYVQSEQDILAADAARYRVISRLMNEVLGFLTQRLA